MFVTKILTYRDEDNFVLINMTLEKNEFYQ